MLLSAMNDLVASTSRTSAGANASSGSSGSAKRVSTGDLSGDDGSDCSSSGSSVASSELGITGCRSVERWSPIRGLTSASAAVELSSAPAPARAEASRKAPSAFDVSELARFTLAKRKTVLAPGAVVYERGCCACNELSGLGLALTGSTMPSGAGAAARFSDIERMRLLRRNEVALGVSFSCGTLLMVESGAMAPSPALRRFGGDEDGALLSGGTIGVLALGGAGVDAGDALGGLLPPPPVCGTVLLLVLLLIELLVGIAGAATLARAVELGDVGSELLLPSELRLLERSCAPADISASIHSSFSVAFLARSTNGARLKAWMPKAPGLVSPLGWRATMHVRRKMRPSWSVSRRFLNQYNMAPRTMK